MNGNRWPLVFLAAMCFILGVMLMVLLNATTRQAEDVRAHRIRNEAVHEEIRVFLKCALALPSAHGRSAEDLDKCEHEAARQIEGTYPPEGR